MSEVALEEQPEAAPVESQLPASNEVAPSNTTDDFDRLLAEYEANTPKPEPETAPTEQPQAEVASELDQLLAGLSPDPKIAQLEGELAGVRSEAEQLRAEAHRAKEMEAFQEYARKLSDELPSWLPSDYAETKLRALAHDETVARAFDYRGVDRAAAKTELMRAQLVLAAFQRANDPRIPQLQQYMDRLNIAINAQSILRKARLDIVNEANKLPPPIDQAATELKAEIAWNMKSQGKRTPDPPPRLGHMSDADFKNYTRENFGF